MANKFTRFWLFLCSYFPLAAIIFVLFVERYKWPAVGVLAASTVGTIWMLIFLRAAQKFSPLPVKVESASRRDSEAISYVVTYVVPFLAIPFGGWQQGVALGIFLVVLGVLYTNSDLIHINPMLNLGGYKLYEITSDSGTVSSLITKRRVKRGETIEVVSIGDAIYLEKRET
mgnify:CR=1 FL=1